MDETKKKCVPVGAVYRMMKTTLEENGKSMSKEVYPAVARYVDSQVAKIAKGIADEIEADGKKVATFESLKKTGDKMGIEFA